MSPTQTQGCNLILVNSWTLTPLKCLSFNYNFHTSLNVFFPVYVFFHFPLQHLQFLGPSFLSYIITIFFSFHRFLSCPFQTQPSSNSTINSVNCTVTSKTYATLPCCTPAEIKRHWISNYLTSNTFTRAADCSKAPLHINRQAANFQRYKHAFTCPIIN